VFCQIIDKTFGNSNIFRYNWKMGDYNNQEFIKQIINKPKEIGNQIFTLRKEFGISIDEVANSLGVSRQQVKQWEQGKELTFRVLKKLADLFNIELSGFLVDKTNALNIKQEASAMVLSESKIEYGDVFEDKDAFVVFGELPASGRQLANLWQSKMYQKIRVQLQSLEIDSYVLDPRVKGVAVIEPVSTFKLLQGALWAVGLIDKLWKLTVPEKLQKSKYVAKVHKVLVVPKL